MQFIFHFAYLDPGTGSLIIQSLIGAIAGVAVFGRRMLVNIKMKFKKNQPQASGPAATNTEDTANKK